MPYTQWSTGSSAFADDDSLSDVGRARPLIPRELPQLRPGFRRAPDHGLPSHLVGAIEKRLRRRLPEVEHLDAGGGLALALGLDRGDGVMVFIGGMIGQDEDGRFAEGFVAQTKQALANVAAVLAQGGASPRHIVRLTRYVRDMDEYLADLEALGAAYREIMGRRFPAMAVIEVNRLVEPQARLETGATAVLAQ
jgi:enamine deaminase RidA (YjgF/YER057c/UK114 family)